MFIFSAWEDEKIAPVIGISLYFAMIELGIYVLNLECDDLGDIDHRVSTFLDWSGMTAAVRQWQRHIMIYFNLILPTGKFQVEMVALVYSV